MKPQIFCDDYCTDDIKMECDRCYIRPIMKDMDDEITRLKAKLSHIREEIEFAQFTDNTPKDAERVRRELLDVLDE